jgi:hypothetical protein
MDSGASVISALPTNVSGWTTIRGDVADLGVAVAVQIGHDRARPEAVDAPQRVALVIVDSGREDDLEVVVAVEVDDRRRRELPLHRHVPKRVPLVIGDQAVEDDLDVAVGVEVRQGHRALGHVSDRVALPLEGPVVLERDEPALEAVDELRGHDLDHAVAVDVAERGVGHRHHGRGDLEVRLPRRAVEHRDAPHRRLVGLRVVGRHHHVGRVAQVDDAVVVVVGEVGDERRDDHLRDATLTVPGPLNVGVEASRRRLLVTVGDLPRVGFEVGK